MRATIEDQVLYLRAEDMPRYRKGGSMVRNSYFWALRSIAARSPFDKPWEFESEVWFALNRMLISFFESGYLGTRETQLEFLDGTEVPEYLRPSATWVATFEDDADEAALDDVSSEVIGRKPALPKQTSIPETSLSDATVQRRQRKPGQLAKEQLPLESEGPEQPASKLPDPEKPNPEKPVVPQLDLEQSSRRARRSTRLG